MIYPEVKDVEMLVNGEISLLIISEYDVITARQRGKWFAEQIGFNGSMPTLLSTFISELARNLLLSSRRGRLIIQSIESVIKKGIVVIASENQPNGQDVADVKQGAKSLQSEIRPAISPRSSVTTHLEVGLAKQGVHNNLSVIYPKYLLADVCRAFVSKKNLADEVRIISTVSGGTTVRVTKWL